MTGHTGFIYSVEFSADSNVLASGSADGTVRIWDVNKDTPSDASSSIIAQNGNDTKRIRLDDSKLKDKKDTKIKDEEHRRKKGIVERYVCWMVSWPDYDAKLPLCLSNDQLGVFPTKHTPIYKVQFTKRNLCLAAGAFSPPEH